MGIRRGAWVPETINRAAAVKTGRYGARPAPVRQKGMSNSEHHMASRDIGNSENAMNSGVSDYRQDQLVRATVTNNSKVNNPAPIVVYSNSYKQAQSIKEKFGLSKLGSITSGSGGFSSGTTSTIRQAPELYSPLFQIANLQLPRERITMNAWNRNFYDTHPLVHNCINLHATYPISKINIKCKDRRVEQFFNTMAERIDLTNTLQAIALELWKIGEVFPYAELDEDTGMWKNIIIQNPDYIHVKTSVLAGEPVISMRPDAALQRLVHSNNPADMQIRNQIDEEVLYHVKKGNNIPLDNFHVSQLAIKSSQYDTHGTSPIVTVYKDLMLYDKLRESKFAQADNLVNPITLVKIGGAAEGEYHPTSDDLEHWRQVFEAAQYDKDFKIISHAAIDVQRVGATGAIIDISPDMNFILDNILYGLMVPKAVITQEGASFNSATVGLEVLKQRYESFRNMMAQWLTKKIFAPISEIQEFYEYKDGDKKLIVPEVEWNRMILFDMDNYINVLSGLVEKGSVSKATLFRSLGLNIDEERRLIKEEAIQQTIAAKEMSIMQGLNLGALRSLKPDEDLIEQTEAPLPGTPGSEESGIPGVMSPGGGGLGGGLPPLPSGPSGGGGLPPLPSGGGLGGPPPAGGGAPGEIGGGPPPAGGAGTPPPPPGGAGG